MELSLKNLIQLCGYDDTGCVTGVTAHKHYLTFYLDVRKHKNPDGDKLFVDLTPQQEENLNQYFDYLFRHLLLKPKERVFVLRAIYANWMEERTSYKMTYEQFKNYFLHYALIIHDFEVIQNWDNPIDFGNFKITSLYSKIDLEQFKTLAKWQPL